MWIVAGLVGVVLVVATFGALALLARVLPPGRTRELAAFVPNALILMRRLRADRRLPLRARMVLGAAIGYCLSPVQLIPNVIPVIGEVDDLAVIFLALRYACRQLPWEEVQAAWPGDPVQLGRLIGVAKRR